MGDFVACVAGCGVFRAKDERAHEGRFGEEASSRLQ